MTPHEQVGVWVLAFFVFLIALFGYLAWTKPDCRAGFVPLLAYGEPWICVSGYKP